MVEAIRQGDIPGVQLRCRQPLSAPPEVAWRWLSEPPRLSRWAGAARLEAGVLELAGEDDEGPFVERGRTLELREGRLWVLAFERLDDGWENATRLVLELTPGPGGCELSVLQQGFEHLPLSRCLTIWERYRRRWREALARLAQAVESPAAGEHPE